MPQFSCLTVITEKVTKISKKASLIESTAFGSYRIFLITMIEITAICFGKVQYIPVWIAREYKSWSLNNIVRLISI